MSDYYFWLGREAHKYTDDYVTLSIPANLFPLLQVSVDSKGHKVGYQIVESRKHGEPNNE